MRPGKCWNWRSGMTVVLDGTKGTVLPDPDAEQLEDAQQGTRFDGCRTGGGAGRGLPPRHHGRWSPRGGGGEYRCRARRRAHEWRPAGEAVGLLRTEFLFQDRTDPPGEDEQFEAYRTMAEALGGLPLIVRTLDAGRDKPLPYISMAREDNPFLGQRGIRLSFAMPDLFRSQLRAILRAASHGEIKIDVFDDNVGLMSSARARKMVEEIRREVQAPEVEIGLWSRCLVGGHGRRAGARSRFLLDRHQRPDSIHARHGPGPPGLAREAEGCILPFFEWSTDGARRPWRGKWVGVCGNLAADPAAAAILIGLDVDELTSASPISPY